MGGMTKRQVAVIVVLGAFVAAVVVIGAVSGRRENVPAADGVSGQASSTGGEALKYTVGVPKGTVAETKPETETSLVNEKGEVEGKLGRYEVVASERGYEPSSLVVHQNDVVELKFLSRGGRFDFFISALGVYVSAPEGGESSISFRSPVSGTFLFECRDLCPAGKTISGQLIVLPKG